MFKFNLLKYRNFPLLRPDLIPLFWSKIDRSGQTPESQAAMLAGRVQTPCHLWVAGMFVGKRGGYGRWKWRLPNVGRKHNGFVCHTHVLAYFLVNNDLPQERGLQLDHICNNRLCCNPDHLEPKTSAKNSQRKKNAKLNQSKVDEIKRLHKFSKYWTQQRIADLMGISFQHVSKVINGECWK